MKTKFLLPILLLAVGVLYGQGPDVVLRAEQLQEMVSANPLDALNCGPNGLLTSESSCTDEGDGVTIKCCRGNTVYYIDGIRIDIHIVGYTGEIVEAENGGGLCFTTIRVFYGSELIDAFTADFHGKFSYAFFGNEVVEFSQVGYESRRIPAIELLQMEQVELTPGEDMESVILVRHGASESPLSQVTSPDRREAEEAAPVICYPNPTHDQVQVRLNGRTGILQVYTVNSRLIREQWITSEEETISLSGLPAGSYQVVCRQENGFEHLGTILLID